LAGAVAPEQAVAEGTVELAGDESTFADFVATFNVPYDEEPDEV
jgi:hypothetical protein